MSTDEPDSSELKQKIQTEPTLSLPSQETSYLIPGTCTLSTDTGPCNRVKLPHSKDIPSQTSYFY